MTDQCRVARCRHPDVELYYGAREGKAPFAVCHRCWHQRHCNDADPFSLKTCALKSRP